MQLGPFCVPCGKRFAHQTTFDGHLSGSKHLKALQQLGRVERVEKVERVERVEGVMKVEKGVKVERAVDEGCVAEAGVGGGGEGEGDGKGRGDGDGGGEGDGSADAVQAADAADAAARPREAVRAALREAAALTAAGRDGAARGALAGAAAAAGAAGEEREWLEARLRCAASLLEVCALLRPTTGWRAAAWRLERPACALLAASYEIQAGFCLSPPTALLLRPWLLCVRLFAQAALLLSCAALPAAAAVPPLCAPTALSDRLHATLSGCAVAASPLVAALVPAVAALEATLAATVPGTAVPGPAVPGAVWALPPAPLAAVRAALLRHAPMLGGAEAERAAAAAGVPRGCKARLRLGGAVPNGEAQPHGRGGGGGGGGGSLSGGGASVLRLLLCGELVHTPQAVRAECLLQAEPPHGLG